MTKKSDVLVFPRDENEVTIRHVPTTGPQRVSTFIDDTKSLFSKHKTFWISVIVIPFVSFLIYLIASQPTIKLAIVKFFEFLWLVIVYLSGWVFPYIWLAAVLIIVLYNPVKKLLRKQKISFNEFQGTYEEVLTMREGENEIILYRDRGSFFETLIKGKEPIYIDQETYLYLKSVAEQKTLRLENDDIDILRVTIMPKRELPNEELFIQKENGRKTLNTKFLLDKADIEEFILKSHLPGVNQELLKHTLFSLTKKFHETRERIAQIEQRYHKELERDFWNYLLANCPEDETAKKHIRLLYKKLQEEDVEGEGQTLHEYIKQLQETYTVFGVEGSE